MAEGDGADARPRLGRRAYLKELRRLQLELALMQEWMRESGARIAVVFEGRDAAGKGGAIKRIVERLNPRWCRIVPAGGWDRIFTLN